MVEWKKLGEVCEIGTGSNNREDACEGGLYPFYVRSQEVLRINSFLFDEEAILIPGEGGVGDIFHYINGKYGLHQRTYRVHPISNSAIGKYIYYYLFANFKLYINQKSYKSTAASIRKPMLTDFPICFPSLSDQQRIVEQLDTFTASIDNLKEQIAQRRKQYEYYRDELLDLEGKEEKDIHCWGEFCEMEKGNGVQKVDFVDEGVGCIHYGQIYTHYGPYTYETNKFVSKEVFEKAKKASKGDIIMTDTSENVEDICKSVAYLGEDDIAVSNHALIIKHQQNPIFLSFSTQTNNFLVQKRKYVVGAKVSGIKPDNLAQIKIYLPSLSEQQRIVSILDTFEGSIQNLEAQLEQRQKQYEYYRNKLLTFE